MVDKRQKGARGERAVAELLSKATGLNFQRTPGSGALGQQVKLKGDIFIPQTENNYTIEVKNYKDDQLTSRTLVNKSDTFRAWWEQAEREAKQNDNLPMLIYKYNRGPWFVATSDPMVILEMLVVKKKNDADFPFFVWYNNNEEIIICELTVLLENCSKLRFIKNVCTN